MELIIHMDSKAGMRERLAGTSWHMDTAERGLKQLGFFVGEQAEMKNGMGSGVYFNNYWLTRQ